MTDEAKQRYDEDKPHYEVIRTIVQDEFKPIIRNLNWFFVIAISSIGYLFIKTSDLENNKANSGEVILKSQYYQIEKDEHRMMKEVFINPSRSIYVLDQINENIAEKLGFTYITNNKQ
jgi:hypothetical protein